MALILWSHIFMYRRQINIPINNPRRQLGMSKPPFSETEPPSLRQKTKICVIFLRKSFEIIQNLTIFAIS